MGILLTGLFLVFLEIVLSLDNAVFIGLITEHLEPKLRKKIRFIGVSLAILLRIFALIFINYIFFLKKSSVHLFGYSVVYAQFLFFFGGLFLLYQSSKELYYFNKPKKDILDKGGPLKIFFKIIFLDLVFSIDSLLTALAVTKNMLLIITAILVATSTLFFSVERIANFIQKKPKMKLLAIVFLFFISVILTLEGFNIKVPKEYLNAAFIFYIFFEFLSTKMIKEVNLKK